MGQSLPPFYEDYMMDAIPPGTTLTLTPEQLQELRFTETKDLQEHQIVQWINVKEKLPEDVQLYLVCNHGFYIELATFNGKEWICNNEPLMVSHWMRLPEPPDQK